MTAEPTVLFACIHNSGRSVARVVPCECLRGDGAAGVVDAGEQDGGLGGHAPSWAASGWGMTTSSATATTLG